MGQWVNYPLGMESTKGVTAKIEAQRGTLGDVVLTCVDQKYCHFMKPSRIELLWMEENVHQLMDGLSHLYYL